MTAGGIRFIPERLLMMMMMMMMMMMNSRNSGVMTTLYRPISCDDSTPLPVSPGFVDSTIYRDNGPGAGWGTSQYLASQFQVAQGGACSM